MKKPGKSRPKHKVKAHSERREGAAARGVAARTASAAPRTTDRKRRQASAIVAPAPRSPSGFSVVTVGGGIDMALVALPFLLFAVTFALHKSEWPIGSRLDQYARVTRDGATATRALTGLPTRSERLTALAPDNVLRPSAPAPGSKIAAAEASANVVRNESAAEPAKLAALDPSGPLLPAEPAAARAVPADSNAVRVDRKSVV